MDERTIAGRYRLTDRIGAGGMGVVWRAEDTRLRRIVAVKELLTRNGFDPDSTRRAVREGRIAARLQHANVIALYDVIEDEGRPWLVMEYLPSRSLAAILADRGALPPDEVRRIGRQLAAGLASAHQAGVVHRDVKPGNVLVTEFGTVKVTDFGTSRVAGEGTLTGSGLLVGTPAYLAPEVARGGETGFPADVFGVGATLYAALEGRPPFGLDSNPILLLHRAAEGRYPPPKNAGSLEPVLTRLLDPDPEARPSMAEAVRMLTEETVDPATVLASALPVAEATRVVPPADVAPARPAGAEPADAQAADAQAADALAADALAADAQAADAQPVVTQPVDAEPVDAGPTDAQPADARPADASSAGAPPEVPAAVPPPAGAASTDVLAADGTTVESPTAGDRATVPAGPPAVPLADARTVDTPPVDPTPTTGEPGPGRRRAALVAGGVLAALLVVVLVVWLNRGGGPSTTDQGTGANDATTTAEQTAGENPPSEPQPTETGQTGAERTTSGTTQVTTSPQPTTAQPTTAQPAASADQALIDYYALLPERLDAGYARLTDAFRASRGLDFAGYQQFWGQMQDVQVSNVQANGNQVTATVTYFYKTGGTSSEQHRYGLVRVGDGWAIDSQS
ncbi:serine/threonine-protein kinase [Saccharothrix australiensis]|uniref:non-specific serine/threonine protein kinase n=1 Tax=Saccharothrix australiensis TaxID=2072 RepID=A0A495W027_9PSEU|nr:serine/threonine-protein kinase [Saccharothrix australiensis]RKT54367.1 serine/threonine protein kinase [Saccharothrix australiensis]